jgi:uncharacterized membrane protein YcaP (DUF421 family)
MDLLSEGARHVFGIGASPSSYTALQICARAIVIYLGGLLILRVGENRFLGKFTAFDLILGFVLGSVLSRAINGSSPMLPTLIGAALLVGLHFVLARISFRWSRFGELVKGEPELLVRDGEILWEGMRHKSLSREDLEEALRLHAHLDDFGQVREARFERNGAISILPRPAQKVEPRVVEVSVRDGVQTVRIEIG